MRPWGAAAVLVVAFVGVGRGIPLPSAEEARVHARSIIDWPGHGLEQLQKQFGQSAGAVDPQAGTGDKAVKAVDNEGKTVGGVQQKNGCEGAKLVVDCGVQCLDVRKAVYGRTERDVCPHFGVRPEDLGCMADATKALKLRCLGKRSCSLVVNNAVVGDPCHGVLKYMTVEYVCGSCAAQAQRALEKAAARTPAKTARAFDTIADDELRKMDAAFIENIKASLLDPLAQQQTDTQAAKERDTKKLQDCIRAIEERKARLGYADEGEMAHCATLTAVALANVDRTFQEQGASGDEGGQWDPAMRDMPVYGDEAPRRPKKRPQHHTKCRRTTSVEFLVSMQKMMPFWPFHVDDPCPGSGE